MLKKITVSVPVFSYCYNLSTLLLICVCFPIVKEREPAGEPARAKTSGTPHNYVNLSVSDRNYKPDGKKVLKKIFLSCTVMKSNMFHSSLFS